MNQTRPKHPDVLATVRECLRDGRYIYSRHGTERQAQRAITDGDVRCALMNGWHEKRKDSWQEPYESWNYAIRGSDLDGRRLRIILALEEMDGLLMVIITVIDLDSETEE